MPQLRTKLVLARVDDDVPDAVKALAKAQGVDVSTWLRALLDREIQRARRNGNGVRSKVAREPRGR